jgi:hypothetical protein
MIIVRLVGRLGNQLFQYAFAMSEQKRLKTYIVIDDRHEKNIASTYFYFKTLLQNNYLNRVVYRFYKFRDVTQLGEEDPDMFISNEIKNSNSYFGYFQSERYFANIKSKIRDKILIKKQFSDQFESKYGKYFRENKVLAVHYRFGDYLEYGEDSLGGKNITLPDIYYNNALKLVQNLDNYLIIIVTDDLKACSSRTAHLSNKLLVSDSEIMDFQILMNADKLIIANSTFSWWAAYLNKKNPEVFAPKYWMGFKIKSEFPKGIIPVMFREVEF